MCVCVSAGYCYQHAIGVEQSLDFAVSLYRRAADMGQADAQFNLGEGMVNKYARERGAPPLTSRARSLCYVTLFV